MMFKGVPLLFLFFLFSNFSNAEEQTSVKTNNISLPSGPGSLEGLGKAFEPSLNTGGVSYSVSIAVPPGAVGHAPELSLNYSSGFGMGVAGLGWQLSIPSIERSLENGQPLYADSDVMTYNGETLVPLTDSTYAPAMQTQFIRFVRTSSGWTAQNKSGNRFVFGQVKSSDSKGSEFQQQYSVGPNTQEFNGTYKWYLQKVTDAKGQSTEYTYQTFHSSPGKLYPKTVSYGASDTYKNTIEFEYEDRPDGFSSHQAGFEQTTAKRIKNVVVKHGPRVLWTYELKYEAESNDLLHVEKEQNALSSGLSLLRKVTRWNADKSVSLPPMRFEYSRIYSNDLDLPPLGNFPSDEDVDLNANGVLDTSSLTDIEGLPTGLNVTGSEATFTDLTQDGLADWLFWKNGQYRWSKNLGPSNEDPNNEGPRFSESQVLSISPAAPLNDKTVHLTDMDGDGLADFLHRASDQMWLYYRNQGNGSFAPAAKYPAPATLRPGEEGVEFADINLDNRMDLVSAQNQYWRYCQNGSSLSHDASSNLAEENQGYDQDLLPLGNFPGPEDIDFNGNKQIDIPGWQCSGSIPSPLPAGINLTNKAVKLVDMNGDRLKDVAWIRSLNGKIHVTWWPHKGRLQFGEAQAFTPHADHGAPDATGINLEKIRLQDINGDGLADLAYIQPGQIRFWLQQFANNTSTWSQPQALTAPNYVERATGIFDADLNGNGTGDFVWVSASGEVTPQYLDISGDTKAHLLNLIDNGMGLRTQLSFTSMGVMQSAAADKGMAWRISSPVAQQIVSKRTHLLPLDTTGDQKADRIEQVYTYRDAYYDPYKKQFRGFSFAKVETLGDSNKGTQISRNFFHTGAPDGLDNDGDGLIDERELDGTTEELALKGKPLFVELTSKHIALADNEAAKPEQLVQKQTTDWHLKRIHTLDTNVASTTGKEVTFAYAEKEKTDFLEYTSDNAKSSLKEHQYDDWGNLTQTIDYGLLDYILDDKTTVNEYAVHTNGIFRMPSKGTVYAGQSIDGTLLKSEETYYDHLPLGQLTRGLATEKKSWKEGDTWVTLQKSDYDPLGNPVLLIDGEGRQRQLVWDDQWHAFPIEEWIFASGISEKPLRVIAQYDTGLGVLTHHYGFNGEETKLQYDEFGRLLTIQKPEESEPSIEYSYHFVDPFRQLEYQFNPQSQTRTTNALDKTSFVQTIQKRDDGQIEEVRAHIDGLGRELATITKDGSGGDSGYIVAESKWYDNQGRANKTFRPWRTGSRAFILPTNDQIATDVELDAHGRPLTETFPEDQLGHRSIVTYEYLSRKIRVTDPQAYQTEKTIDADDKVLTLRQQHHINNELVWQTSTFVYDAFGRMTRIIDAHNNIKEQKFNGLDHKIWQSDLDQGITEYEYDNAGHLTLKTDQMGRKLYYTYDQAGRLSQVLNNNYSQLYAYHYDKPQVSTGLNGYKGKLTWVEEFNREVGCVKNENDVTHQCLNNTNSEHYHYDLRGNLIHKKRSLHSTDYHFHYQYDLQNRLTRQVWPDGDSVDYQYDLRGQIKRIGSIIDRVTYHEDGQVDTIDYANGSEQARTYDDKGQLTDLVSTGRTNNQIKLLTYNYDLRGNLTRIDDILQSRNSQVFEYDAISQLKKATGVYGQMRYQYDAIGNMTGKYIDVNQSNLSAPKSDIVNNARHNLGVMNYGGQLQGGGGTRNRMRKGGQPGPHAITSTDDGKAWSYNAVGQRIHDNLGNHYQWDQLGRMTQWQKKAQGEPDTDSIVVAQERYQYDFKGRRLFKKSQVFGDKPSTRHVFYVDKNYEIRDDTTQKHIFLGNLRVARLETPIVQALPQIQQYSLNPGWNQVQLPITPDGSSVSQQLGDINHQVQKVLFFNADQQGYKGYSQYETDKAFKTLGELNARGVYWLNLKTAQTWTVQGKADSAEKVVQPLKRGWNQVTLPLKNEIKTDVFARSTAIEKIWSYDAANNKWSYWQRNPNDSKTSDVGAHPHAPLNTLQTIKPNTIYWVYTQRDQLITQANGITSTRYFLHNNHLGSVAVTTDSEGAVKQSSVYLPYGAAANLQDSDLQPYSFSAKELDGSGLYYFEARFYDPLTARFISPDPLFAAEIEKCVGSMVECNLYQYTGNNPVNFVDILGLEKEMYALTQEYIRNDTSFDVSQGNSELSRSESSNLSILYGSVIENVEDPVKATKMAFGIINNYPAGKREAARSLFISIHTTKIAPFEVASGKGGSSGKTLDNNGSKLHPLIKGYGAEASDLIADQVGFGKYLKGVPVISVGVAINDSYGVVNSSNSLQEKAFNLGLIGISFVPFAGNGASYVIGEYANMIKENGQEMMVPMVQGGGESYSYDVGFGF